MPPSNIAQPPDRPGATRAPRRRGFTLVEILTATAIMALIISLVMSILTQVMNAWNLSTDQLTLSSESSEILNIVTQDLEGAIFKRDGNQWLYLGYEQPAPLFPYAVDSRLIFFTPTPLRAVKPDPQGATNPYLTMPGDLCTVEYRVVYADPFGVTAIPQKVFSLHRVVVDAATTYLGTKNGPVMGLNGQTLLNNFFDTNFETQAAPGKPSAQVPVNAGGAFAGGYSMDIYGGNTTQSSLGLDNIAQFTVLLYFNGYKSSTIPTIQVYPSYSTQVGYDKTKPVPPPAAPQATFAFGGAGPGKSNVMTTCNFLDTSTTPGVTFLNLAYADITLSLFTDEGLQTFESWNGSPPQDQNWNQFFQQYTKTYTRRVYFQNQPQ